MRVTLPLVLAFIWVRALALPSGKAFLQSDMKFDRISVQQGLSNFTVSSIAQDTYGFLWIGTEDGLNRYDGYNFTIYRPDENDSISLPGPTVSRVYVDRRGELWAGVLNEGVCRYDPIRNGFKRYKGASIAGGTASWVNVSDIFEDQQNRLWLCTNRGLWTYVAESDSFVQLTLDAETGQFLSRANVKCAVVDENGMWWLGTFGDGLMSYDPANRKVRRYTSAQDKRYVPIEKTIIALCLDRRGFLWIATIRGVYRFDRTTGVLGNFVDRFSQPIHLTNGIVLDVREDSKGNIWVGTFHGGLYRYIPAADTFLSFTHDPDDPRSLVNNRIEHIFEDRTGGLWFASYRAGLNKYTAVRDPFFRFKTATPRRPGINGDAVYAIAQDSSGRIVFGTNEHGLTLFDPMTGRYSAFRFEGAPRYGSLTLCVDRRGNIWSAQGMSLRKLERHANRFINVSLQGSGKFASNAEIKCITEDHAGNIWVGLNEGGLFRINASSGATDFYRHVPGDSTSLPWHAVWCVFEDSKHRLWVGTFGGGIGEFNPESGTFTSYQSREGDPSSLSGNVVYSISEDNEGYLWVGTFSRGLNRFDPASWKVRRILQRDGLPNNFVKVALPDNNGNLWISTDQGISKLDPRTWTFTNFTVADGLHGDVFLSGAYCRTRDGMMIFGGMEGATAFYPDSIAKTATPPPVVLTSFLVFDKPYSARRPVHTMTGVRLNHDQNFVSFEFAALDFTASERNRYKYQLEGLDTGWVDAGTRRFARYTHLSPGEYTFRVIGANKDGVWNETGTAFSIVIAPPFWGTWWFRIGVLVLLVAAAVGIYNYRVNRLLEIERLRVRIASDLHDDIGSSLTKISLQSELIQEGIEPQEMTTYLKNIAAMSRELVTSMSDIVWSIDARNDTIENLIEKMRNFAAGTLSPREIYVQFSHSGLDVKRKVPVDVRENVYLIFKEAINNIAKHADASSVSVIMRNDSDKFSLFVIDNGKGWEGSERLSGHGIKNMRMRAERLGGTLEVVRDEGTRVVLTLKPL